MAQLNAKWVDEDLDASWTCCSPYSEHRRLLLLLQAGGKLRQMQKPPERDAWIQLNDQKGPHPLPVLGHPCGSRETRRRPSQPRCRGVHAALSAARCAGGRQRSLFTIARTWRSDSWSHRSALRLQLSVRVYNIRDRYRSLTKLVASLRLQDGSTNKWPDCSHDRIEGLKNVPGSCVETKKMKHYILHIERKRERVE
ncbi:unnamed protein product [Sphagnum balticum]